MVAMGESEWFVESRLALGSPLANLVSGTVGLRGCDFAPGAKEKERADHEQSVHGPLFLITGTLAGSSHAFKAIGHGGIRGRNSVDAWRTRGGNSCVEGVTSGSTPNEAGHVSLFLHPSLTDSKRRCQGPSEERRSKYTPRISVAIRSSSKPGPPSHDYAVLPISPSEARIEPMTMPLFDLFYPSAMS